MAVREIKTTLAIDGEKAFDKAIKEAGRNMRIMASEMKAAAADFNLTGDEMEYLGKKSKSLNDQINQQKGIITALEQAVKESSQAYGDASEKTDGYRIKLNNAQAAMAKLKKELEDSNREMTELGRDSGRVGRQLETGIGEAAEDAGNKFDVLANKLSTDISSIHSTLSLGTAMEIGSDIVQGIQGAYDAVTGLVDASMDYNRTMSFLEVNAAMAGHSFETIKQYAIQVAGITGDMDASVEGMSNLLKAGLEADEMALAVERLSGAIIQFPDTLKFESLADSLQETIATGSAVGQYAEYLERTGQDLDVVNKALKNAKKNSQEAVETVAMAMLSENGAEEVLAKWTVDNSEMVDYYMAQATLTDAQANLAKELTPIATAAIDGATVLFNAATEATKEAKKLWEEWKVIQESGGLFKENETVTEGREENLPTWDDFAPGYETEAKEEGEETGEKLVDGIKESIIKQAPEMPTWDDFAPGYSFDAETTGEDIATGIKTGMENKEHTLISEVSSIMASMQAEASKGIVIPIKTENQTSTASKSNTGTQGGSVTLALDGKSVGSTTYPYISTSMGLALARTETYG